MNTDIEPKTIVWIEDDVDVIDPVVRPLERAGYRLVRLRSAAEALSAIELIRHADLILLDMILPPGRIDGPFHGYAGENVLYELRKVHDITTPVIVFTVVRNNELRLRLGALGVTEIVNKPVRPSELKERVEKVLGIE